MQHLKESLISSFCTMMLLTLCNSATGSEHFNFSIPDIVLPGNIAQPEQDLTSRIVHGAASKGPISGAAVTVYEIDDTGLPIGNPVASTTTDASGGFTVSLPAASGMLLVMTSGGSFIDESDQRPLAQRRRITLSSGDVFKSIINSDQSAVAVTPYTDALVERARTAGRLGGFEGIMQQIESASTSGFGFNIFSTLPADPVTPAAGAGTAQLQYAMLLGTVANIANTAALKMGLAAPNYQIIKALILDMSDGSNDGLHDGHPIAVSIGGTTKNLPNIDFDQQLLRFRNNNYRYYADTPLPAYDDGEDDLSLNYPSLMFSTFETDVTLVFGIGVFSVARIELNSDGTGFLLNGAGGDGFTWAGLGNNLQIDFSAIGGKVDEVSTNATFNANGALEQIQFTTITDSINLVLEGTPNGKKQNASMTRVGRTERHNLTTGEITIFDDEFQDILTIYDAGQLMSFPSPATWEEFPALSARTGEGPDRRMGVDQMQVSADGTGVAQYKNVAFNWSLPANGSLRIDFDDGEYGNYYPLQNDDEDPVDYVAVDYFDGEKLLHTGTVVFSNRADLDWNNTAAPGIYVTVIPYSSDGGEPLTETFIYHTYPDGTGAGEFEFADRSSGLIGISTSNLRICWTVNQQGELVRTRVFIPNEERVRGPLPTVAQCQGLQAEDISLMRIHELYDIKDTGEYLTVVRQVNNDCGTIPTPGCNTLTQTTSYPALYNEVIPLETVPPIPANDSGSVAVGGTVTLDVLSNDIVTDLPIDTATLSIANQPAEMVNNAFLSRVADGSATVNNGIIEYTPNPGNPATRLVNFAYRVNDTAGNPSIAGNVFITVNGSP